MDQNNYDALHMMCINTVEYADACFESFQEKVRCSTWVLKTMKETYKARKEKLQGNLSEDDSAPVDDGEADEYEDIHEDVIPETSQVAHEKNVREFVKEHKQQDKIIAAQEEEALNLKVANMNFTSQTDEAESLELFGNKIAEEEVALAQQKQCLDELYAMVKSIYAQVCMLRSHIRKERPGLLPQNEIDSIRNFRENCKQKFTELLDRYGYEVESMSTEGEDQEGDVGEDEVSEEHQPAEGEYEEEHDEENEEETYELVSAEDSEEDEEEHEGDYEGDYQDGYEAENDGEDEGNDQGQAMQPPVQPAALTFNLPIIGGRRRGREDDADEADPAAKRVFR